MCTTSDAYILVTILSASITSFSSGTFTGKILLEYIAFKVTNESASAAETCNVLLILCVVIDNGAFECL
jgi:hypothetical protein